MSFPKLQPQISQLDILFNGPLIKDSQVESINDLIHLNYNYEHKIVWVKSEKSNFYLNFGNGSEISHWEKIVNTLTIEQYNESNTYSEKAVVYLSGKLYKAIQNVEININPIDNPNYWLLISGESITNRYVFINTSSVIVYSDIKNPIFEIISGDIELDVDNNYVIDTDGLIKINNPEIIEGYIKRRQDLPNNNGMAFEISFEENCQPILLTGAINIK